MTTFDNKPAPRELKLTHLSNQSHQDHLLHHHLQPISKSSSQLPHNHWKFSYGLPTYNPPKVSQPQLTVISHSIYGSADNGMSSCQVVVGNSNLLTTVYRAQPLCYRCLGNLSRYISKPPRLKKPSGAKHYNNRGGTTYYKSGILMYYKHTLTHL